MQLNRSSTCFPTSGQKWSAALRIQVHVPLTDCLNMAENIPLGKNVPPGPDTAGVEGEASDTRSHLRRIARASILWEYSASAKGYF